jgi:hypothetical protein
MGGTYVTAVSTQLLHGNLTSVASRLECITRTLLRRIKRMQCLTTESTVLQCHTDCNRHVAS